MAPRSNADPGEAPALSGDLRDRVGLVVEGATAAEAVAAIVAAEAAGVRQVWMTQGAVTPDTLTLFAAAAARTTAVRLGTAIVTTYPRHPLVLAQQALALADLAPGRLRLGIGPSHRQTIEQVYGLPMTAPLTHLREYTAVLRGLLWGGRVSHHGRFFNVEATLPRAPRTPLLLSALRAASFRLAGEVSDGALSWLCPLPYLRAVAAPALREGAAAAGRPAPPLVAHVSAALNDDRAAALAAARERIRRYAASPFYAQMFAEAGYPIPADGTVPEALADSLVISGDEAAVRQGLRDALGGGIDELLVMPIPVADAADERARLARLLAGL
ncbi:MAG TPA: LLM class flavin-dependent oxidoreductase [Thermomicrobiales bacterium]|nr:LLM class flavin-dependent oxidoreductase [Thermomicrobiales bacterium]